MWTDEGWLYLSVVIDLFSRKVVGWSMSDDLKAVLDLTPGKTGLLGRLNDTRGDALPLAPVDRDTFQRGMQTVRFRRDQAGKVIALDLTNPALRRITFARLSDRPGRP